jgi:hypothetical protein
MEYTQFLSKLDPWVTPLTCQYVKKSDKSVSEIQVQIVLSLQNAS